jgi:pilus assembly protein CpaF
VNAVMRVGAVAGPDVDIKRRVHLRLLSDPDGRAPSLHATDGVLRSALAELLRSEAPLLPRPRHEQLLGELLDEVAGLGPLQPLFDDHRVTEVMVNGPNRVYVERAGCLHAVDLALDAATILRLVERIIGPLGLRLDRASPVVDARLPDGSRLHAVIPPLALDGPCVTIRRFAGGQFGSDRLDVAAFGAPPSVVAFLAWAVANGANLVVSGGTSAGKTTLCNALGAFVPADDRVVTIEETAELQLPLPHVVRLEARPPNAEGAGAVPVRALVRAALRMRPDRIVVGEVRGGEAFDLLQALNTGHDGSLTTVHANGVDAVVDRITGLVLMAGTGIPVSAAQLQLAAAVDFVVHVARRNGARRVETVGEVHRQRECVDVEPIFATVDGVLRAVGAPVRRLRRPDAPPPDPAWFACSG